MTHFPAWWRIDSYFQADTVKCCSLTIDLWIYKKKKGTKWCLFSRLDLFYFQADGCIAGAIIINKVVKNNTTRWAAHMRSAAVIPLQAEYHKNIYYIWPPPNRPRKKKREGAISGIVKSFRSGEAAADRGAPLVIYYRSKKKIRKMPTRNIDSLHSRRQHRIPQVIGGRDEDHWVSFNGPESRLLLLLLLFVDGGELT